MNTQKFAKVIWKELIAFLAWAAPTLWTMFTQYKPKNDDIVPTGTYETEDGHLFTTYSDGTTDSGAGGIKKPLI